MFDISQIVAVRGIAQSSQSFFRVSTLLTLSRALVVLLSHIAME